MSDTPQHDRQRDVRRLAKLLRDGGYTYDQSAHLFKLAREQVGLTPPKRSRRGSVDRLSSDELDLFLKTAYARSGRRGLMMRTLFETGARVGTFARIDAGDIAFSDLEIRARGKGDKVRDVPILQSLATSCACISASAVAARSLGAGRAAPTPSAASSRSCGRQLKRRASPSASTRTSSDTRSRSTWPTAACPRSSYKSFWATSSRRRRRSTTSPPGGA